MQYFWEIQLRHSFWTLLKGLQPSNYTYSVTHKHSPCRKHQILFQDSTESTETYRPVASGMFCLNVLKMKFCPWIRHVLSLLNSMFPGFLKKIQTGRLFTEDHPDTL